jgi:hypothetical protein
MKRPVIGDRVSDFENSACNLAIFLSVRGITPICKTRVAEGFKDIEAKDPRATLLFQPLLLRQARCALSFVPSLYINWERRLDKLLPPGIRPLRLLRVACEAADSL